VAARLIGPELDAGFGLRTMSAAAVGFNPLGYHTGSIWPHDTAIAVHGLRRAGFGAAAATLAGGLLDASVGFDARLPELYAGHAAAEAGRAPAPYPAACRPQAWAAASVVLVLRALLGLEADVPDGVLRVAPVADRLPVPLRLDGLQVAGQPLSVDLAANGELTVSTLPGVAIIREFG